METELIIPLKEKLISFETAKLAKEKGFHISSRGEGMGKRVFINGELVNAIFSSKDHIHAPTQSLLQKWLREVHNIIVDVSLDFFNSYTKESIKYSPTFYTYSNNKKRFWTYTDYINSDECTKKMQEEMPIFQNYSTYEEALEIGLQETLKLIK